MIEKNVNAVMPAIPQAVIMIVIGCLIALGAVYAFRQFLLQRDDRMLILLVSGLTLTLEEGLACFLIHCQHAPVGMYELYYAFGVDVPIWIAELYVLFFGVGGYVLLKVFSKNPSAKVFWPVWLYLAVSEGVFEVYAVHVGMLCYYGAQPLLVYGFPSYMGIVNASQAMAFVLFARIWFAITKGLMRWTLVLISAPTAMGIFCCMILPAAMGIDAGHHYAALSGALITVALALAVASLALAGMRRVARVEANGQQIFFEPMLPTVAASQ